MGSRALVVVVVFATGGCNQLFGLDSVGLDTDGGDGDHDSGGRDSGGDVDARSPLAWSQPTPLEFATAAVEEDPTMSQNGLELYFARRTEGDDYDIVRYDRVTTSTPWILETTLSFNSTVTDWTPKLSFDDRTLYLASDRGGTMDAMLVTRTAVGGPWGLANELIPSPPLNTASEERGVVPCQSGSRFVFASNRNTSLDLFELEVGGTVTPIPGASDAAYIETSPFLSEDCLTLYFTSTEFGDADIMVMTRASVDTAWSTPQPIPTLSSGAAEGDPWVSADGRHMILAIDPVPLDGDFDLYESFR